MKDLFEISSFGLSIYNYFYATLIGIVVYNVKCLCQSPFNSSPEQGLNTVLPTQASLSLLFIISIEFVLLFLDNSNKYSSIDCKILDLVSISLFSGTNEEHFILLSHDNIHLKFDSASQVCTILL